jgi:RNA polymerase sigma-70 factor (ECF subfamily)
VPDVDVEKAVKEHAAVLLRGALALGLQKTEAEDLVQDTFATFLKAAERFEGRSSLRTFLFGILYRKAMERGRKAARELPTDPADAAFESRFVSWGHWSQPPRGPDQEADLQELSKLISDCIGRLPEQQKAAFLLKEVEMESSEEVRNALDVEDTHLRVLLFRARTKLRDCIEGKWRA